MLLTYSLLALVLAFGDAVQGGCPSNLPKSLNNQEFQGQCFRFVIIKRDYSEAEQHCKSLAVGGHLASVKDADTNKFLAMRLANQYNWLNDVWIGLNDVTKEGIFVWEDGTPIGYDNFAPLQGPSISGYLYQPEHFVEDCVALRPTSFKWYDYRCRKEKAFVCQFPWVNSSPITDSSPVTQSETSVADYSTSTDAPMTTHGKPDDTTVSMTTVANTGGITTPCAKLTCNKDCGLEGYVVKNGCVLCQCEGEDSQ